MIVPEGIERFQGLEKFFHPETDRETPLFYGRDRLRSLRLENGDRLLIRSYRHGGLLRHVTGDFFFTWPPRPFRELVVTEEARRRGIETPEIFGAGIERVWGPFYRGWLATRELEGGRDLWAALQSGLFGGADRGSWLRAVARSLKQMHRQGLYHGDLNLKNILIQRGESGDFLSYIIDLDQATLFLGEVPPEKAQKNLKRLLQSARKLDPEKRFLSQRDWDLLMHFYREAGEG